MSWVATACMASTAGAVYNHGRLPKPVYFQPCGYCTKAPDEGQKEARCTSCGAPLKEKESSDDLFIRLQFMQEKHRLQMELKQKVDTMR